MSKNTLGIGWQNKLWTASFLIWVTMVSAHTQRGCNNKSGRLWLKCILLQIRELTPPLKVIGACARDTGHALSRSHPPPPACRALKLLSFIFTKHTSSAFYDNQRSTTVSISIDNSLQPCQPAELTLNPPATAAESKALQSKEVPNLMTLRPILRPIS
jgi:hypothetical protein